MMRLMTGRTLILGVAAAAVLALPGCSGEAWTRAGYETLHNVSDARNDGDGRYDADRPSFDEYQRRRAEALSGRAGEGSPGAAPALPAGR